MTATAGRLPRLRAALVLGVIAVLFTGLDATFIFSGPFLGYVPSTLPVFLLASAFMMVVLALGSRFRCAYAGFQDEAVVILSGVGASFAVRAGAAPDDDLYATFLVTVIVSTVLTGVFFLMLGTLRIGRLIRYVPFSVTAGFMITVGALLMSGGIQLAESRSLGAVLSGALAGEWPLRSLFALCVALLIVGGVRWSGGVAGMPVVCLGVFLLFHAVCALTGMGGSALAEGGWLMPVQEGAPHPPGWLLLLHADIDWRLVFGEWRSMASIALISALALLLAVTALELTTRQRVDVDRELRAAGWANLASAGGGGGAGYHDDAVSAMLHKNLGADRDTVLWAALFSAAVAALDPAWFALVPLPLLGGMLLWLGWQLWRDWLVYSGHYLHRNDWLAVVAIVVVTVSAGFISGVLLGIGVGIALFLVDYSQVSTVRYVVSGREIRSNIDRSPSAEQLLYDRGSRVNVVKLQGYLFFARSHQVLVQLEPVIERERGKGRQYIVIDFQSVAGVDSTATMAFVRLRQIAAEADAGLVFTGLGMETRVDLAREELAEGDIGYFSTLDQGLAWCEDQLLEESSELPQDRVDMYGLFDEIVRLAGDSGGAGAYLRELRVKAGDVIMDPGSEATDICLLQSGSLSVVVQGAGRERIVLRGLEPGSVFGEMALYLGGARTAAVVAETDAVVLSLGAEAIARLEEDDPRLATRLHKLLARLLATKLRQTNTWLSHLR